MPIKGMTTTHQPGHGLPRLGVLHKGAARTQEDIDKKKPGRDLGDKFRIVFAPEYAFLAPAWAKLYGGELITELRDARLIAGETDAAFTAWMEAWGASGLIHRCDGETQVAHFDPSIGRVSADPITCQSAQGCGCKQVGRMEFFLPAFTLATGVLGKFTLATHAVTDIKAITAFLRDIEMIRGTLFGVPLIIGRREQEFAIPELDKATKKPNGKRITVKKWVVTVRPSEDFTREQIAGSLTAAAPPPMLVDRATGEVMHALPEPRTAAAEPEWTEANAMAWSARMSKEYGINQKVILQALNVNRLGEWAHGFQAAEDRLDEYIVWEGRDDGVDVD